MLAGAVVPYCRRVCRDLIGGVGMQRSRRRTALLLATFAFAQLAGLAPIASAVGTPTVTAAVQVTANPTPVRGHSAPQIVRNPKTGELVVVQADVRGDQACTAHISTDDGRSWALGGELMVKPFVDCTIGAEYGGYASPAFGSDGTLYVAFIGSEFLGRLRDDTPRHLFLARSVDGGRNFERTRVFEAPDGNPDRGLNKGPTVAVDPADPKRVYVGWRQGIRGAQAKENLKTAVAASADGGRTFGPPVNLADDRGGDFPWLTVGPGGTLHAIYWTRTGTFPPLPAGQLNAVRPILYRQSNDQGKTWTEPVEVDPGNQRSGSPRPPVMAADPRTGTLYTAWYSNTEPNNLAPGYQGDLEIFFRRSTDGGKTWGQRVVLNDDGAVKANQFLPGIAIAPNGRVDVAWYDGRLSPKPPAGGTGGNETGFQDVYATWSTDHGVTFEPNLRITDRSIDRSVGVWSNNIDSHHAVGVTSTNESVYFAWQDSRNSAREAQAEDVYMASLKVDGAVAVSEDEDGIPSWALWGVGLVLGMGLAMSAVWLFSRRSPQSE